MYIKGLGGFREVGRMAIEVETERERFLLDYGIEVQKMGIPMKPDMPLTSVLLSHSHLDHSGMVPELYKIGYSNHVYSRPVTFELAAMLLRDSLKVQGKRKVKSHFLPHDIEKMEAKERTLNYEKAVILGNSEIKFYHAGHVPGASSILVESDGKRIVYTGDINFIDTALMRMANRDYKDIDVMMCDSTYYYKNHPNREQLADTLREKVQETVYNDGVVVLPSFAVGRAQELLLILHDLGFQIYMDGMAVEATRIILNHPDSVIEYKGLKRAFGSTHKITREKERKQAIKKPGIIITTSGMLNGGPVNYYIKKLYKKENCSLILTGFQVPGCVGRKLLDTGRYINNGLDIKVNMKVEFMDFSVLPSTPVLIKNDENIKILPIKDVKNHKFKTYSFNKNTLKCDWHNVDKIIKHKYEGEIYKITTKSGRNVEVTKGHSLFILKNGEVFDIPSDMLAVGDYVLIPKAITGEPKEKEIDLSKFLKRSSKRIQNIKIIPQLYRLLGYYIAEGHCTDRIVLSIGKEEDELKEDIITCIKTSFPLYPPTVYTPHPTEYQIKFGSSILSRFFKDVVGSDAYNKRVPEFILSASKENIGRFIGAYLEGDGWWDERHIRVKSVSENLISDLMYLLYKLDIIGKYDGIRISKRRKTPQGLIFKESKSHILRIQGYDNLKKLVPFLRNRLKVKVETYLKGLNKTWTTSPHALPIKESGLVKLDKFVNKEVKLYIYKSLKYNRNHIDYKKLSKENLPINIKSMINGDVAFDKVVNIEKRNYSGYVYDFSVPGPQNFTGGFGGIFLHNSAHCGRDDLIEFLEHVNPKRVFPVHTDGAEKFAGELKNKGFDAYAPKIGEKIKV